MKRVGLILALTFAALIPAFFPTASSQRMLASEERAVALLPGVGNIRHTVSTDNPEAQRFFDQGLNLIYAFNHEEAIRSFRRAAELDPKLAMAHWGVALALGPNINLDVDPEREKAAFVAVQKALSLAGNAPMEERALIEALAKRYSIEPGADLKRLAVDYKNAMGEVVRRFPDDLDAATLYAESAMNLRPWQLWDKQGKPAEGTEEIVAVLESVLRRNPNHMGAIHYYIHTVEASTNPERALTYAPKLPQLAPASGHLVHMPAHVYIRTGDYEQAALSNKAGAEADQALFKITGTGGMYPVMYYNHNLHFLAIAHAMQGRFADALAASRALEDNVGPHVHMMPMLEGFMTTSQLMLVRFRRWDEILKLPQPDAKMLAVNAVWHFARGMAQAAKGNRAEAERELKMLSDGAKVVPTEAAFGLNSASNILKIAEQVLSARLFVLQRDYKAAIESLKKGVEIEDALAYDEPPAWFLPVRESLGGALLLSGNGAEAEKVFRTELEKNLRSGRALFGLSESLKAQSKRYAAAMVQREFENAWRNADTQLRVEDL
jgi:tetratricopeptide (TPR) repeat protein